MNLKNVKQKIKDDARRISEFLGLKIDRSEDAMSVNCVLEKDEKELDVPKVDFKAYSMRIEYDVLLEENDQTEKHFDLESLLDFQLDNDVQIVKDAYLGYNCLINGVSYNTSLTPLNALVMGVKHYKERKTKCKSKT